MRESQLGYCPDRIVLYPCLWGTLLVSDWCGILSLPWVVLSLGRWSLLYKKAGWARHGKEVSKMHCSVVSVSVPTRVPALTSWTVSWKCEPNKPLLSQVAFSHGIYHSNKKQTKVFTKLNFMIFFLLSVCSHLLMSNITQPKIKWNSMAIQNMYIKRGTPILFITWISVWLSREKTVEHNYFPGWWQEGNMNLKEIEINSISSELFVYWVFHAISFSLY